MGNKSTIIALSGKGGVGKSLVTSLLSVYTNRLGYNTAILDADITGPSIPKSFGIKDRAKADESGLLPEEIKNKSTAYHNHFFSCKNTY